MEIIIAAVVMGLAGSFHCIGMCGPIAISLPMSGDNIFQKIFGGFLYNTGRTVTYGIMGAVFGLIGQGFQLVGFQKWVSIIMGSLMIVTILLPSLFKSLNGKSIVPFMKPVHNGIRNLFQKRSLSALFLIGLLNGLLPCGLVYLAIAGAIGTGSALLGAIFMIVFGLGTLPMMLAINLLGNIISLPVRNKINKVIPYIVVTVGIIFIMRGLTLGIPYLSPPEEKLNPEFHLKKKTNQTELPVEGACCKH